MENDVTAAEAPAGQATEESAVVHEQTLDEILAGVDSDLAQPETQVPTVQHDDSDLHAQIKVMQDRQNQFDQQQTAKETDEALIWLVSFVRDSDDGISSHYDDEDVRGWLELKATQNPKIAVAFANRHSDKAVWNNVRKTLAADLAKKVSGRGSVVEQSLDAAASVRGVSTTPPPEQDLPSQSEMADMAMNDPIAFRRFKEKL